MKASLVYFVLAAIVLAPHISEADAYLIGGLWIFMGFIVAWLCE